MAWIGFALTIVLLSVVVAVVFRSHRPTSRSRARNAPDVPPGASESPALAVAATPAAATPVETPSALEPAAAKTAPAAAPRRAEPAAAKKDQSSSRTDDEIPTLFVPDADEPATVVTQRFQPQAMQSFLEGVEADVSDGPSLSFGFILVSAVGRTDVGRRRKHNEDSYLVLPEEHLFVVADGMGGHAAGEVASAIAVETLITAFREKRFHGEAKPDRPRRADELVRAIELANAAIFKDATEIPEHAGMGTTIVAARFAPTRQRVFIAHAGDSRCYRLRDGEFSQLTQDHTMAAWGVGGREGEKLTRALGIADVVEIDVTEDAPIAKDQYLICSDGLTKMLDDATISEILAANAEPENAVRVLIGKANERGGRDNITAIVIQVHETVSM